MFQVKKAPHPLEENNEMLDSKESLLGIDATLRIKIIHPYQEKQLQMIQSSANNTFCHVTDGLQVVPEKEL